MLVEDNLCGLSILYWFLNTLLIYCIVSVVWLGAHRRSNKVENQSKRIYKNFRKETLLNIRNTREKSYFQLLSK